MVSCSKSVSPPIEKVPDIAARHPKLSVYFNYPQHGNPQHAPMAQQAAMKLLITLVGDAAKAVPADIETVIAAIFAIRTIVRLLNKS